MENWQRDGLLRFDESTVCYDGSYGLHLKPSAKVIAAYYRSRIR